MILVATCPSCLTVRASSGDVPRGTRVPAAEFTPVPGQPQPVDGQVALCSVCSAQLAFRWLPTPGENGAAAAHVQGDTSLPIIARQVTSESAAVKTVFHVQQNEEVLHAAPAGPDKFLIVTNQRAVVVDVAAIAEGR